MHSKERVFATLGGNPVDRRPFSCLLSLYGANFTGCSLETHYSDPARYAAGQRAVRDAFSPDVLFAPFSPAMWAAAFGGKVRYFETHPPNLVRPVAPSIDAFSGISIPDVDAEPHLLYFREAARRIVEEHGDEVVIVGSALSPVDMPIMIMGLDAWLRTVLFDPDGVRRVLEVTVPTFLSFVNAMFEEGIDAMALPAAFLTPAITTRKIVEEIAVPTLKTAFSQVHGPLLVHHVGCPFLPFFDLFCNLPNTAGFVVDPSDDLAEARKLVGQESTLLAGTDGGTMNMKTADQIREECLTVLESRQNDPRFILASCGADIPLDTPRENILAMCDAVETDQMAGAC